MNTANICTWNVVWGAKHTFGTPTPTPDFENTRCILLWGANPRATFTTFAQRISKERLRGAKLIVIDPRQHHLARWADCWLRIRPGNDSALALAMIHEIGRWQQEHAGRLTIALVSEGTADQNRAESSAHGVSQILLQKKREIADAYKAWGTPGAVLIGADCPIASPLAQGADAIRAMVAQAAGGERWPVSAATPSANSQLGNGHAQLPAAAQVGDPAPLLELHDLGGKAVVLNDLDDETLVLFWNPGCGFCQNMLDDLRQ